MEFWLEAALVCLIMFTGAFVQRVSGFGFGIVVMTVLPHVIGNFAHATALSSVVAFFSTMAVALSVVKHCDWKNLIFPLIGSFALTFPCLYYLRSAADQRSLFIGLGILLILLSVFFFIFSAKIRFTPHWYSGLLLGSASGTMNGLFSMGGPPMVVYFLQSAPDKTVYLATIQMFFFLTNVYSNVVRILLGGFYTTEVFMLAPFGIAGMIAGNLVGKAVFGALDSKKLRYVVYAFMGVSGAVTVVEAILR